jgi:ubiquinone biosynthesis protein
LQELPADLLELSRSLRDNRLRITVAHQGLLEAFQLLDRGAKRVSTSIVIASIVLGSSIIFLSGRGPQYLDVPFFSIVGFCVAAGLGLWSLIAAYFEKKR